MCHITEPSDWTAMSRWSVLRLGDCLFLFFFFFTFFHLQKKQCWSGGLIVEHRAFSAGRCDQCWLGIRNAASALAILKLLMFDILIVQSNAECKHSWLQWGFQNCLNIFSILLVFIFLACLVYYFWSSTFSFCLFLVPETIYARHFYELEMGSGLGQNKIKLNLELGVVQSP